MKNVILSFALMMGTQNVFSAPGDYNCFTTGYNGTIVIQTEQIEAFMNRACDKAFPFAISTVAQGGSAQFASQVCCISKSN